MTTTANPLDTAAVLPTTVAAEAPYVGLSTRVISWVLDFVIIDAVAIIVGLGVLLVVQIFPITKGLQPLFAAIAGGVYVLWTAAYFVAFWSTTGQTPGARVMQVHVVTPDGQRLKPRRALLRWFGMSVALIPLPWGFVPIPFRRLGFPDWLAHTRVIEIDQLSVAAAKQERLRDPRTSSPKPL